MKIWNVWQNSFKANTLTDHKLSTSIIQFSILLYAAKFRENIMYIRDGDLGTICKFQLEFDLNISKNWHGHQVALTSICRDNNLCGFVIFIQWECQEWHSNYAQGKGHWITDFLSPPVCFMQTNHHINYSMTLVWKQIGPANQGLSFSEKVVVIFYDIFYLKPFKISCPNFWNFWRKW